MKTKQTNFSCLTAKLDIIVAVQRELNLKKVYSDGYVQDVGITCEAYSLLALPRKNLLIWGERKCERILKVPLTKLWNSGSEGKFLLRGVPFPAALAYLETQDLLLWVDRDEKTLRYIRLNETVSWYHRKGKLVRNLTFMPYDLLMVGG